jgi:hypothetical protein
VSPRRWLLAVLGAAGACGPRPAAAGPQSCAPTTAALEAGASAAGLEGEYRVRLVATTGPRQHSSADGTIALVRPAASADSSSRRYVLVGTGELALVEVGAPEADLASADPSRPGILVFDLGSRILLRLGAEVNRQDVTRVEGAYTVLRVQEVRADGFAGEWTSGAPLPMAEGYFCAWKSGAGVE